MMTDSVLIGPLMSVSAHEHANFNYIDLLPDYSQDLCIASWIKWNGVVFKPDMIVCCRDNEDEIAKVERIFKIQRKIYVISKICKSSFIHHLQAYEVAETHQWICINENRLKEYFSCDLLALPDGRKVTIKE